MTIVRIRSWRGRAAAMVAALIVEGAIGSPSLAGDTAGLPMRQGRAPIRLWPYESEGRALRKSPLKIGEWEYSSRRAERLSGGVPWELMVVPGGPRAGEWRRGEPGRLTPILDKGRGGREGTLKNIDTVPVVEVPDVVWKGWLASDMRDVVGIHYHALVTDDVARILYTLHRAAPTGRRLVDDEESPATRVEATLLTPLVYHLDQSILVRTDAHRPALAAERGEHELGHAQVSQRVFLDVMKGRQDWNEAAATGRRSRVEYFWKRELIGRPWKSFREGVGQVATLRTTVALVPPTRWSMLLPIPPERVTQRHLEEFNDSIVHLEAPFAAADRQAQEEFHSHRGEYEAASP